jgi:hypothetical protein
VQRVLVAHRCGGGPTGAFARAYQRLVQEVNEREAAERALRESKQRFRALVHNASDVFTAISADGLVRLGGSGRRTHHRSAQDPPSSFPDTPHTRAVSRLAIESDLRRAIETQQLEVHYQPIIRLRHRRQLDQWMREGSTCNGDRHHALVATRSQHSDSPLDTPVKCATFVPTQGQIWPLSSKNSHAGL